MTSLFAQSKDQHDVPSCSMRKIGSGSLTMRDEGFPPRRKNYSPKTGRVASCSGGLTSSGSGTTYIESDPSSNVPANMPSFRGFPGRTSHWESFQLPIRKIDIDENKLGHERVMDTI